MHILQGGDKMGYAFIYFFVLPFITSPLGNIIKYFHIKINGKNSDN